MSNLEELRKEWEKGLNILCTIPDDKNQSQFFVVLRKGDGASREYFLHRYFSIGTIIKKQWHLSVDVSCKTADYIFTWLGLHKRETKIPIE